MTPQAAAELVTSARPRIVYLSGKTSTGKSTFANKLRDELEYMILDLDDLVYKSVIEPFDLQDSQQVFIEVYRQRTQLGWIDHFVTATREAAISAIEEGKNVVLDGAIAHPDTLQELLKGFDFLFLYFHPESLEHYYQFLLNRFLGSTRDYQNELPLLFWNQFKDLDLNEFYENGEITPAIQNAIKRYTSISQKESIQRLTSFKKRFMDIYVVNI